MAEETIVYEKIDTTEIEIRIVGIMKDNNFERTLNLELIILFSFVQLVEFKLSYVIVEFI